MIKETDKKQKCMTLSKSVTDETEKKIESFGGKLSPIVEKLLIKFNKGEIKL